MKYLVILWLLLGVGCHTIKQTQSRNQVRRQFDQTLLSKHFTGFGLYDPELDQWLYEHNTNKYFTPASNVKILTLYAGTKLLGDSLPSIYYAYSGDTLMFKGLGDPTFLHPDFPNQKVYSLLANHSGPLLFSPGNIRSDAYGPGWNWDDYRYDFQPERNEFPIYGNVARIVYSPNPGLKIKPSFFNDRLITTNNPYSSLRYPDHNIFVINENDRADKEIPFRTYPELTTGLLMDTLKQKVLIKERPFIGNTMYSQPSAALYSIMMKRSDNFFAEQILLMGSSRLSDSLTAEVAIQYILNNHLTDLPDKPIWVDGSGLSRYNLITPRSQIKLLDKLRNEQGERWLFSIFPAGGQSGTIKNWYGGSSEPYVYAKTGTLRNNHNLSGYLITDSGKTLIFSFMNNNHTTSLNEVKGQIQNVLELIRKSY